ncbi:MAG: dCTP deaminase [Candidatus Thorarchaeota archaeon]|nr:dCTP deaminase [Candidatus Thorarchaeota archaeon]
MMLSDSGILTAIENSEIAIDPFDETALGPCSIDLTLDSVFRIYHEGKAVDIKSKTQVDDSTELVDTEGQPFTIQPRQFVLGQTKETIMVSENYAALLEGRSSIARLGIIVHAAGLVNPGTGIKKKTKLTLEIFCENASPVLLYPGMKIVQIMFVQLSSPARRKYDARPGSKYIGQEEPRMTGL